MLEARIAQLGLGECAVGAGTYAARARLVGLRRAAGSRPLGECFGAATGETVAFICVAPTRPIIYTVIL